MFRITTIAASAVVATIAWAAMPAEARFHGRAVSVQGSGGRGYVAARSVDRQPGSVSANRSFQTNSGRGVTSTRSGSVADGTYTGGATHTLNNGESFGRSTTATANGDGTASFSTTRNRIDGSSATVSGVVTRAPQ
ncbi:hypothetical protein [Sphingomonas sp. MMS24-J13]|uniref:hypothetical protein n=1 Tax=Sphingomonas sp. MMS24-J13 TaxID=3238686 RepID=UPI0038504BD4